ncbi:MAG: hypothetical protein IPM51_05420 [Sphingobacteriaceae bacterium]|nr:hypothetical protein [Sphingobacteriaceae bacterium]
MAVYRFRVYWEDNEDVYRDIDIKAAQSFAEFHTAIQQAFKFDDKHSASFFVSDDYWRKNQEVTLKKEDLPLDEEEIRKGISPKKLMADVKIAKYIEQPHQRFVYIFDSKAQWSFLIEMVKIAEDNPKLNYPVCSRSVGTAPKQYKQVPKISEEELNPENGFANLLKSIEIPDEEVYKAIASEDHAVDEEDLGALEGEEGEEDLTEDDDLEKDEDVDFEGGDFHEQDED